MIFRGPIGDGLKEFRGESAAVRGVGNYGKKPVFDLLAVGIGETLPTGVAKEVRLFIPEVIHQHVSATKNSDRSSLAIAMVSGSCDSRSSDRRRSRPSHTGDSTACVTIL
jgi:hypothetical protein